MPCSVAGGSLIHLTYQREGKRAMQSLWESTSGEERGNGGLFSLVSKQTQHILSERWNQRNTCEKRRAFIHEGNFLTNITRDSFFLNLKFSFTLFSIKIGCFLKGIYVWFLFFFFFFKCICKHLVVQGWLWRDFREVTQMWMLLVSLHPASSNLLESLKACKL